MVTLGFTQDAPPAELAFERTAVSDGPFDPLIFDPAIFQIGFDPWALVIPTDVAWEVA